MKKANLTTREWVLLSEYADGQLTSKQQIRAERLFQENPATKVILIRIQYSKELLANLPAMKAPRNFTLNSIPDKKIQMPSLFSAVRFSAIAAIVLFIAVLISDLFIVFTPKRMERTAQINESEMMAADLNLEEESAAPDIIYWSSGPQTEFAYGKGAGQLGGIGGGGGAAEDAIPHYFPPPDEGALSESAAPAIEGAPFQPESVSGLEEDTTIEEKAPREVEAYGEIILGIPPAEKRGFLKDAEHEMVIRTPEAGFLIPILKYILGLLAVIMGFSAWILRKR